MAAHIRRCHIEGAFAAVRRRGAEEAGAIFVKVSRLDGSATLFAPAPQTAFEEARPSERLFVAVFPEAFVAEEKVEARIGREIDFDSDAWVIEIEDRAGRHFLELAEPLR